MTSYEMTHYASPMPMRLLYGINYIVHNGNGYLRDDDDDVANLSTNGWASKDTLIALCGGRNVGLMLVCDLITPCAVMLARIPPVLGQEALDAGVNYKRAVPGYTLTEMGRKVGRLTDTYGPYGYRDKTPDALIEELIKLMALVHGPAKLPEPVHVDMPEPGKFASVPMEVGKRYRTYGGDIVTIIYRADELRGYETVQGDDMGDYEITSGYRYNRVEDRGRCTGSKPGEPHNLIPEVSS